MKVVGVLASKKADSLHRLFLAPDFKVKFVANSSVCQIPFVRIRNTAHLVLVFQDILVGSNLPKC